MDSSAKDVHCLSDGLRFTSCRPSLSNHQELNLPIGFFHVIGFDDVIPSDGGTVNGGDLKKKAKIVYS